MSELNLEFYQNKYNDEFNTKYIFDGKIKFEKINDGYVIWINLIVFNSNINIYNYSREFIISNYMLKNKYISKSLFMDQFEFIDIINQLEKNDKIKSFHENKTTNL